MLPLAPCPWRLLAHQCRFLELPLVNCNPFAHDGAGKFFLGSTFFNFVQYPKKLVLTQIFMVFLSLPSLEQLNTIRVHTMVDHIGLEFTGIGEDFLEATLPVDHRTIQPMGLLHGGANVVLAETLGSVAASLTLDRSKQDCVGLEINANHLRAVKSGKVKGTARPVHLGKSTQVWEIKIVNEADQLCCISRITMAILDKK
jgi:1,4-dihydroxy-2-naphthoyl-CoA hydrolase